MAKGNELKQRVTKAIIAHAFFRLESALTIALTIMAAYFFPMPFPWWQWWYWIILGAAGEILIIYTSVTDERTGRQVVADMLRQEFNPREIQLAQNRQRVEKALEYRHQIEEHVRKSEAGVLHDHLAETTAGVADWVANVFGLAKRLDAYGNDPVISRDCRDVPREIADLRLRLQREDDGAVQQQLQQAIASKEEQLTNLKKLQNLMEKAEYQLETTLTALGTVYSQVLLINAKDIDSGRAQRLRQDIADQVAGLQSVQDTLDEVYGAPRQSR
jgi:hypothetical protein